MYAAQTVVLLNCGVKSRWSATLFVYLGFNVSQAVSTCRNSYWNNSLIKIICLPISRRKWDYSLCVSQAGVVSALFALLFASTAIPGAALALAPSPQQCGTSSTEDWDAAGLGWDLHNTQCSTWRSRVLASSNQNGPHGQLEKLFVVYWCQVAAEATVAGRAQSGIGEPLSSNLLPASDRGATVPSWVPAIPQDQVCWF